MVLSFIHTWTQWSLPLELICQDREQSKQNGNVLFLSPPLGTVLRELPGLRCATSHRGTYLEMNHMPHQGGLGQPFKDILCS